MVTLQMMQFTAVVLMALLTVKLLFLRERLTIKAHPDWGNDAVAQHCGFTDRTVLQRTFKRMEGITPQKYQENMSKGE